MRYSGSRVFIPSGPSSFFSATSRAFQALSTVNSSGACKRNRDIMSSSQSWLESVIDRKIHQPIESHLVTADSTYHYHGNSEVGPQLVVTPGAWGSIAVLIDAFFVHQVRVFLIRVMWVPRYPETCLKGLLELLAPLGVCDKHLLTWNTITRVISILYKYICRIRSLREPRCVCQHLVPSLCILAPS